MLQSETVDQTLSGRLAKLRDALSTHLVEREVAVRLALLAALAGEHMLLIGPPGTAKSMVARRLSHAIAGGAYFERLLTRFTVPEELFGPLSIAGLQEDRYERLTRGYMPTASVAFLDEIFKANSAILNALLTILNEREFDNGTLRQSTPLVAVVAASNELPQGEELEALYDRFLLRLHVGPVSDAGFEALLEGGDAQAPNVAAPLKLSLADLAAVRAAAASVEVPAPIIGLLAELRRWTHAEQIRVSDRRWRKIVRLLQTSAWTNGRATVSIWDCWLLQHCIWSSPDERAKVQSWYEARVGTSAMMDTSRLVRLIGSWERKLEADQQSRSHARDAAARPLYLVNGHSTVDPEGDVQALRDGKPLYRAPEGAYRSNHYGHTRVDPSNDGAGYTLAELNDLHVDRVSFGDWPKRGQYLASPEAKHLKRTKLPPHLVPTQHKQAYLDRCLVQLDEVEQRVVAYQESLAAHQATLEAHVRSHLWVTADFVVPAAQVLRDTHRDVAQLADRLALVRRGFAALPSEAELADLAETA